MVGGFFRWVLELLHIGPEAALVGALFGHACTFTINWSIMFTERECSMGSLIIPVISPSIGPAFG